MKIRKGTTRIALVLFDRYVFKFPRLNSLGARYTKEKISRLRETEGFAALWKSGLIGMLFQRMMESFLFGVSANVCEGWLWLSGRASFLQPTLCLIICNVQRHAGDKIPAYEQMEPFFKSLPKEGKDYLRCIDPHQFDRENWRIVDGRLRLIDYGGKLSDHASFPSLLSRWKEDIENGLSKPVA